MCSRLPFRISGEPASAPHISRCQQRSLIWCCSLHSLVLHCAHSPFQLKVDRSMIRESQENWLRAPSAAISSFLNSLWRDDAIRTAFIVFVVLRLFTGAVALIQTSDSTLERPPLLA